VKVRPGSRVEDIQAAVKARLGVPVATPLILTDQDGYDVILDQSLPTGIYQASVL